MALRRLSGLSVGVSVAKRASEGIIRFIVRDKAHFIDTQCRPTRDAFGLTKLNVIITQSRVRPSASSFLSKKANQLYTSNCAFYFFYFFFLLFFFGPSEAMCAFRHRYLSLDCRADEVDKGRCARKPLDLLSLSQMQS